MLYLPPKVRLQREGVVQGVGLVATESITAEEVLFEVPRRHLLSEKTSAFVVPDTGAARASKSGAGSDSEAEAEGGSDDQGTAGDASEAADEGWAPLLFAIMAERAAGAVSPWAPYLGMLPTPAAMPHPHFWGSGKGGRGLLEGTRLPTAIEGDLDAMKQQFEAYWPRFSARFPDALSGSRGKQGEERKRGSKTQPGDSGGAMQRSCQ